ncbi:MAG: SDR family oxidoreductase [Candidatus Nitronauta litoralis]|uniref:SDR family oxidoreductase n=1 Tax=Candidatus Nitronauta litoralis TaxID=2705533 RepID=A0A7T0G0T1_9BACT|nr:MAG: SDR family oxidoreductase [Candidatus Nitronauta litoralis]
MKLAGKTTIITGGATGIGLACAELFLKEGGKVVLFGRRQDRLEEAKKALNGDVLTISGDITQETDVGRLVNETRSRFESIDILINNAGTFAMAPLHEMAPEEWDRVLDINLRGVFLLTRNVIPSMLERGKGSIVHISSILGMIAAPQTAAYNASKAALSQFSRSLAVEYGPQGIRSNTICPGLIETEMTEGMMENKEWIDELSKRYPIGRFGKPQDVAQACLFFASDVSSFITGTVLPVDGGCTAN